MTKGKANKKKSATADGGCIIPPALPKGELHKLLFRHSESEAQEIKDYVEWLRIPGQGDRDPEVVPIRIPKLI
jgi:hypothetical protein